MKILLDHCAPATMRKHLKPHEVKTTQQMGWVRLENGDLLDEAQHQFDVLISTDSNIKYQRRISDYDISLIVLRGVTNALPSLVELVPQILELLTRINPGEVHYLFTEEMLEIEKQRGRQFKR
jgi:predicted nuclease of predicted toxin-antitoxin system